MVYPDMENIAAGLQEPTSTQRRPSDVKYLGNAYDLPRNHASINQA